LGDIFGGEETKLTEKGKRRLRRNFSVRKSGRSRGVGTTGNESTARRARRSLKFWQLENEYQKGGAESKIQILVLEE